MAQPKSKTRTQMEEGATYLASGHEGRRGLDPKQVEQALFKIKNWKKYFVQYVSEKPLNEAGALQINQDWGKYFVTCAATKQLDKTSLRMLGITVDISGPMGREMATMLLRALEKSRRDNSTFGKVDDSKLNIVNTVFNFYTSAPMGASFASQLADVIFLNYYNQEVKAFEAPTLTTYDTRDEVGYVEYGDHIKGEKNSIDMKDSAGNFTGAPVEEHDAEVFNEVEWRTRNMGVAKAWTPDDRKKENYGQLLSMLCRYPNKKGRIILNANLMQRRKAITPKQLKDLCAVANNITRESVMRVRLGLNTKVSDSKYFMIQSDEGTSYI